MRNFSLVSAALLAASALVLASCSGKGRISGVIEGAGDSEVVVALLNVNALENIDTLRTDSKGHYSVSMDVQKGCPEFVYLYRNGVRVAALLLENGARLRVESDTLGHFSVEGSREAELYASVENDYNAFLAKMDSLALEGDNVGLNRTYVDYYRGRLKFMAENPYSLANVPVLYQTLASGLPLFSRDTDAIYYTNVCDSLETVYPDSRYVKSLRKTARERGNLMNLNYRIRNAEQVAFPEISLPDLRGKEVKLSGVEGKLVMLYFWAMTPQMKMFNVDQLLPIYEEFHKKGLEIYSVALEADKTAWASVVRGQKLPWINVCDIRQEASPLLSLYNVTSLPYAFFIKDGAMMEVKVGNAEEIRKMLAQQL